MLNVVAISGSPSFPSRSYTVLEHASGILEQYGISISTINLRKLPPEDLMHGKFDSPYLKKANDLVMQANGV
jgi:FMN reductase